VQFVVTVVNNFHFHFHYIAYLRTASSLGTPSIQYFMTIFYPFALDDGGRLAPLAVDLVDRFAILVVVRRFSRMGAADSASLWSKIHARMKEFVRGSKFVPFRRFPGDVHREFMQRLCVALHGTLGSSYLRNALQVGGVAVVVCLRAPRP
jgi:hypothetical protein